MDTASFDIWQLAWKVLFIGALVVFAAMSVWVTIGGFKDLKTLFQRLSESNEEDSNPATHSTDD